MILTKFQSVFHLRVQRLNLIWYYIKFEIKSSAMSYICTVVSPLVSLVGIFMSRLLGKEKEYGDYISIDGLKKEVSSVNVPHEQFLKFIEYSSSV